MDKFHVAIAGLGLWLGGFAFMASQYTSFAALTVCGLISLNELRRSGDWS